MVRVVPQEADVSALSSVITTAALICTRLYTYLVYSRNIESLIYPLLSHFDCTVFQSCYKCSQKYMKMQNNQYRNIDQVYRCCIKQYEIC